MILPSRRRSYRPQHLDDLLERRRALFEHWTHDASVIPMSFYPYWQLRFRRDAEMLRERWRNWRRAGFEDRFDDVLERIREGGPVMAREFGGGRRRDASGWWGWHPSKTALEFLWRTGALAIDRREGFQKVFDLADRVIPAPFRAAVPDDRETLDWACAGALDRLSFASAREIAAFWDTASLDEARAWCAARDASELIEVEVEGARPGEARHLFARPDICEQAERAPEPPGEVRVLSPFDPLLRDRKRTEWVFGFRYRIEIYVPEEKPGTAGSAGGPPPRRMPCSPGKIRRHSVARWAATNPVRAVPAASTSAAAARTDRASPTGQQELAAWASWPGAIRGSRLGALRTIPRRQIGEGMNKVEMAERLATRTGMNQVASRDAVDNLFATIGEALAEGEEVRIAGFGTCAARSRPARPVPAATPGPERQSRYRHRGHRRSRLERHSGMPSTLDGARDRGMTDLSRPKTTRTPPIWKPGDYAAMTDYLDAVELLSVKPNVPASLRARGCRPGCEIAYQASKPRKRLELIPDKLGISSPLIKSAPSDSLVP